MWVTHILAEAFAALDLIPAIKRPLLGYLDELSHHLDECDFDASTALEQAVGHLEAVLHDDNELAFEVPVVERSWRTAIGYLLEAAIDRCSTPPDDRLSAALRACVRHLDVDLRQVWWLPPVSMRDTQERLARALGLELPSILSDYQPVGDRRHRGGK